MERSLARGSKAATLARLAACLFVLVACETPPPPGVDGGPGEDASTACALDRECQDGVYCNGEERCMPGATDADERGCVPAYEPPCREGYTCEEEERYCRTECDVALDGDGDGAIAAACGGDDCDDTDANRFPGNVEVCDASDHDEDCNPDTFGFVDADGDGSGVATCCNVDGDGARRCGNDCNDSDSLINPRAGEPCDLVDNDCDGEVDDGCPCDPGATRTCGTDTGECVAGREICIEGIYGDCVGEVGVREEICDALDNDCDGETDEFVERTYYADTDGDGYGVAATSIEACSAPEGFAANMLDCDDARATVNPGNPEICNDLDDDCDGSIDEGLLRPFYTDADGDGFGLDSSAVMACAPAGRVERGGDCDDTNRGRSPVGVEVCNGADDDCDTSTDEGVLRTYYRDQDGDGVGGTTTMTGCAPPAGYVATTGDCADTDDARYPGRFDACNGIDDDCNGTVDPGCACTDGTSVACGTGPGGGPATNVGECSIGAQLCVGGRLGSCVGAVGPVAERCNGLDDDCDGNTDEGTVVTSCLADADGDGYGAGAMVSQCRDATRASAGYCPPGWTTTGGDCSDSNAAVRPGATEACNGIDDNCTGGVDEGVTVSGCYTDGDGDTYGIGSSLTTCRDATRTSVGFCALGYTNRGGDCNDLSSAVRPGATELCNGSDDDCDMAVDDGPGMICALGTVRSGTGAFGSCGSVAGTFVCNAGCTSETFTPAPPAESCNGLDDDCDGARDEAFECRQSSTGHACVTSCGGVGTRSCSATCSFTGQACVGTEICNGCDDDGDGVRDDGLAAGGATACALGQTRTGQPHVCGGTGTQTCLGDCSGWGAAVRPETCDGCDEDRDGTADNGFACVQGAVVPCTTACGTPGQRVCNATCSGYSACVALTESCNFCDDDGDGSFDDDRPLATGYRLISPTCPGLSPVSATGSCPLIPSVGLDEIRLVNNGSNDAGAVWVGATQRLGWETMRVRAQMEVSKSTTAYLPADGWALVLADGGSGTLGAVGGALGVPMTRTGLAIEWRFYNNDPNVDQVDTITVRRLTGSGTGAVIAGPVTVPSSQDFGSGDLSLVQTMTVLYTPDDPSTLGSEERLQVQVAGVTLITLTPWVNGVPNAVLLTELAATSTLTMGLTAATGGRVFMGDARFGFEFEVDPGGGGGGSTDYATTWEFYGTCD